MKQSERDSLFNDDFGEKEWLGEVVDNNDPEREMRCKIKVYSLFDDIDIDMIPWAFPAYACQFAGDGGGYGACSVPRNGTIVKVRFSNSSIYAPEYFAIQNINPELKKEIADDYANAQVLCYDVDEKLKMYYTQGKGLYINLKDTIFNIDNNNAVHILNPNGDEFHLNNDGTMKIKTSSNITVDCQGDMTATVKGTAEIEAKKIKLGHTATEALVQGKTFKPIFDNHYHIGNLGAPTGTAIANGFETPLSTKSYTD
jgi:hypothetical protein